MESMIHRRGTENVLRKSPIAVFSCGSSVLQSPFRNLKKKAEKESRKRKQKKKAEKESRRIHKLAALAIVDLLAQASTAANGRFGSIATDEVEVTRSRMSASPLKADNLHTISASPLSARS